MARKKCPKCGKKIPSSWSYHNACGWGLDEQKEQKKPEKMEKQPESSKSEYVQIKMPGIMLTKDSIKDFFRNSFNFVNKHKVWLLLLIPLLLAFYVRVLPAYTPVTAIWAENSITDSIRNQIASQIDAEYPNLTSEDREELINIRYSELDKTQFEEAKASAESYFNDKLRDEEGNVYLHAIDPYQHYRRASNLVDHGNAGDEYEGNGAVNGIKEIDGKKLSWDALRNAPYGVNAWGNEVHVRGSAYAYLIIHKFFKDITLMEVMFFVPAVLGALSVIPIFFIARKFAGDIAGFFAGAMLAIQPGFLVRTVAGFSDTDVYPIFFGLFIAWFFLESLKSKNVKGVVIWGALAGVSTGFFVYAWSGWWYIFLMILATIFIYTIYVVIRMLLNKKLQFNTELKNIFILTGLLIGLSFVVSYLLLGNLAPWLEFITGPSQFIHLKDIARNTLFPNINVTIAEMGALEFQDIIARFGKPLIFWLGLIGIPLMIFKRDDDNKIDFKYVIFLTIWVGATIFASLRGNRFVMMLVPPWSIAFGICIGMLVNWVSELSTKINISKAIATPVIFVLACTILLQPVQSAIETGSNSVPGMNDGWYGALNKINQEASEDAIINSWWDFGHWFAAIGNRRVTFDGAHQVPYGAFWVGHALYTDDEKLSVGILRMLDCGANTAEIKLNSYLGYTTDGNPETIRILSEILPIPHTEIEQARQRLKELAPGLTDEQISDVLSYSHCDPPEDYFITSTDMIGKASVWGHFGKWDFKKAQIYNKIGGLPFESKVEILKTQFGYGDDDAYETANEILTLENNPDINYPGDSWISIYPGFISAPAVCHKTNNTMRCENGPIINLETMDVTLISNGQEIHPVTFTYNLNDTFYTKGYTENTVDVEVLLVTRQDESRTMLSVGGLAPSTFSRLHFYAGLNMEHFELFDYVRTVTGDEVFVWRVDWTGNGYFGKGTEV